MQTTYDFALLDKQELSLGPEPTTQTDLIFEKYRIGANPLFSAFRLYSTDVSCEEDDSEDSLPTLKTRGSYRKYTQQEKQMAVSKVYFFLFRF